MILVSDGQETGDLRISDVTPDLVRKGIIVDTIQIDIEDAVGMTQLAIDTNGRSFYDSGLSESTDLLSSLKSSIAGIGSAASGDARIEVNCTLCRHLACLRNALPHILIIRVHTLGYYVGLEPD